MLSRNLKNEETLAHWRAVAPETNKRIAKAVRSNAAYEDAMYM